MGRRLGGGLELALGCHVRIVGPDAKLALPEVNLGIIPGSGGTQRLPRLIGIEAAVKVVAENVTLDAKSALSLGLADHLAEGLFSTPPSILPCRPQKKTPCPNLLAHEAWRPLQRSSGGGGSPHQASCAGCIGTRHCSWRSTLWRDNGFTEGLKLERETFLKLRASEEAAALRYLFFAERAAPRPADLRSIETRPLASAGVVGGGNDGRGHCGGPQQMQVCRSCLIERDQKVSIGV